MKLTDRFVRLQDHPHLHALLHRYGIPKGVPVRHQVEARAELERVLAAAYAAGQQDPDQRGR